MVASVASVMLSMPLTVKKAALSPAIPRLWMMVCSVTRSIAAKAVAA